MNNLKKNNPMRPSLAVIFGCSAVLTSAWAAVPGSHPTANTGQADVSEAATGGSTVSQTVVVRPEVRTAWSVYEDVMRSEPFHSRLRDTSEVHQTIKDLIRGSSVDQAPDDVATDLIRSLAASRMAESPGSAAELRAKVANRVRMSGQLEEAALEYRSIIQDFPDDPQSIEAFRILGQLETAVSLTKARGGADEALRQRADIYLAGMDHFEQGGDVLRALSWDSYTNMAMHAATALEGLGEVEQAVAIRSSLLHDQEIPITADTIGYVLRQNALAHMKAGQSESASQTFEALFEFAPDFESTVETGIDLRYWQRVAQLGGTYERQPENTPEYVRALDELYHDPDVRRFPHRAIDYGRQAAIYGQSFYGDDYAIARYEELRRMLNADPVAEALAVDAVKVDEKQLERLRAMVLAELFVIYDRNDAERASLSVLRELGQSFPTHPVFLRFADRIEFRPAPRP